MRASFRDRIRAAAVLVVVAGTSLLPGAGVAAAATALPAQAPTSGAPAESFASCLARNSGGQMLLLFDQSSSLRGSDPKAARVAAASYLVGRLAADAAQRHLAIDAAVAGFDSSFRPHTIADPATKSYNGVDWTPLTGSGPAAVTTAVDDYGDRNGGGETDYWSALNGAAGALRDRAVGQQSKPCQAIVWFTDGKLDIEPRLTPADVINLGGTTKRYSGDLQITSSDAAATAQRAAEADLCRGGGVADALRSAGVSVFAIGLESPGQTQKSDFELLRGIATGTSPTGGQCGDQPSAGTFQLASDLDGLLKVYNDFPYPSQPAGPPIPLCQGAVSECKDRHQFVLDRSITTVHILGTVSVDGAEASVVLPDQEVVQLPGPTGQPQQTAQRGGVTFAWTWPTSRTISIDLTRVDGAQAWPGAWALAFSRPSPQPGATSTSSVLISTDLQPALLSKDVALTADSIVPGVRLGLVTNDTKKEVVPTDLDGAVTETATLISADGTAKQVATAADKAALAGPVSLDLTGLKPGSASLRLTLTLTTAAVKDASGTVTVPGTQLVPETLDVPVTLNPPARYPTVVGPADFGLLDGVLTKTATVTVTGPGCVWIDAAARPKLTATPDNAAVITVGAQGASSASSCLKLQRGQRGDLTLALTADRRTSGPVRGSMPVTTAPLDDPSQTLTQDVELSAELQPTLETGRFLLALLAALLLGPGIPLALLYLVKWYTARVPARPLSARQIPVQVVGPQVLREGAPFAVRPDDFVQPVAIPARGARTVDAAGVRLKTKVGWSPLGPGYVSAFVPGTGLVAASSETPPSHGRALRGRLPLAVHNKWVVLHDPAGPPDQAAVLMLVGGETSPEQRADRARDVTSRLPDVLARLRQAAERRGLAGSQSGGGPAPGDPYGSAPGGRHSPPPGPGDPFGPPPGQPYPAQPRPGGDPFPSPVGFGDPFGTRPAQAGPDPTTRPGANAGAVAGRGASDPRPYDPFTATAPGHRPDAPDPWAQPEPVDRTDAFRHSDPHGGAGSTTRTDRRDYGVPPTRERPPDQSWPPDPFDQGPSRT